MSNNHTGEIAAYLRALADRVAAMDEDIPGEGAYLEVKLSIHRRADDRTTNGVTFAFADRFAAATDAGPCRIDGNCYRTSRSVIGRRDRRATEVTVFPLRAEPEPPRFDPNI
jgi:hypothetical protein